MTKEQVMREIQNYVWQAHNGKLGGVDLAAAAILALFSSTEANGQLSSNPGELNATPNHVGDANDMVSSPTVEGWQPIETAPINIPVLVAVPAAAKSMVGEAMLHDHGEGLEWWWANEYREYHADQIFPARWMPLPPAPPRTQEASDGMR